ncbi:MAG: primosomal protein N' [Anaerovoracaceae bacterium]
MKYVNVVVDNNSKHTDTFYTYGTEKDLAIGQRVFVPFNRGNKVMAGYVFEVDVTPSCELSKIKQIERVDEDVYLSAETIETATWMKKRYGIKYLDGIKCFVPTGKIPKKGKEKEPYKDLEVEESTIEKLTLEQENAVNTINESIKNNIQDNYLIHGITGSGKTEIYIRVIKKAIEKDKTAIMLVPEIALTKQVIDRFVAAFGKETIAVLHSKLTMRERFDEWIRIRTGKAKVVIGARLAVFAPLENIGVIILDEEHESTYKSDMTPKYETVDVALKRLMYYNGVLVLGSATPSVISYQRAKDGIYKLIELKNRYNNVALPSISIVDMRDELKNGNTTIFSKQLYNEITENLKEKKQIILFLNRRGYSTIVTCKECGEAIKCPDCGITLTYHKSENVLNCHYCGRRFKVPEKCPACGSEDIRFLGTGTEKVEEGINDIFPDAVVERLDLDTAKNKGQIEKILNHFAKGKTDILIGTQMVAKGLDFKNVGLVGVISADTTLNIPDYRSCERTFQLVTQVAGRAGRGEEEGKVVVQSFTPDNFALLAAQRHSYEDFFNQEITIRRMMSYPPFSDLIMVLFTSSIEKIAEDTADSCREYLERCKIEKTAHNIFSPKISQNFKGSDSFRYYILIKSPKGLRNKYVYFIDLFCTDLTKKKVECNVNIDVNPYSIF